jgi:hypothetical protein
MRMAGKGVSWLRQKGSRNESRVTFVELFFALFSFFPSRSFLMLSPITSP